jgi:hypothetical protein
MNIAVTGANSDLAGYLIPRLRANHNILRFSRVQTDFFFDFESAGTTDFRDAEYVFHFAHPYSTNSEFRKMALNQLNQLLISARNSHTRHVLISSLSSYPENSSYYSDCKARLEDLFRMHGQSVIRIGIVQNVQGQQFRAYSQIRNFLKLFPFKVVNLSNVSYYFTEVESLLTFIDKVIAQKLSNFSYEIYADKPFNLMEFTDKMLVKPRRFYLIPIDSRILKKILAFLSRFFLLADKVLNVLEGMGLKHRN